MAAKQGKLNKPFYDHPSSIADEQRLQRQKLQEMLNSYNVSPELLSFYDHPSSQILGTNAFSSGSTGITYSYTGIPDYGYGVVANALQAFADYLNSFPMSPKNEEWTRRMMPSPGKSSGAKAGSSKPTNKPDAPEEEDPLGLADLLKSFPMSDDWAKWTAQMMGGPDTPSFEGGTVSQPDTPNDPEADPH
jgi:hypothetical protein